VIRIHTANGGGYGDPRQRSRELVLEDLRNGYLTEHQARSTYRLTSPLTRSESDRPSAQ
jgi:N-methylhydantoinase B